MMRQAALVGSGAVVFAVLLLLNAGGYRYGITDQAFYIPVVLQQITPDLFPHDAELLAVQDRLFLFDDWFAKLPGVTTSTLPTAFFAMYLVTLGVLYAAVVMLGRALSLSWWAVAGVVVGLSMRHRIPDTAVNSVEGYFHPRMLAFAIGLLAVAVFLRSRTRVALLCVAVACVVHPTTAVWFVVWVGIAALVHHQPAVRTVAGPAALAAVTAGAVLVWPMREQLAIMDPTWVAVLASKDYLFSTDWPLSTWLAHLSLVLVIGGVYWYRRSLGVVAGRERALVIGCAALVLVFVLSVPLAAAHVALAVQLQVNRVFWLIDLFAIVLAGWLLIDGPTRSAHAGWLSRRPRTAVVIVVLILALARGGFRMLVERAGEPLVRVALADSDWQRTMQWAGRQPVGTHFLAHPVHASRYGTSVRAASARDVYLEFVKDVGMAIYSSRIAHRVADRTTALGTFETLTPDRARALAARYDLDFLITEQVLDLPEAYRSGSFTVYALRAP